MKPLVIALGLLLGSTTNLALADQHHHAQSGHNSSKGYNGYGHSRPSYNRNISRAAPIRHYAPPPHYRPTPHANGHWKRGHDGNWLWVVPTLIGGALVYDALTTPNTVVVEKQPSTVIVQQPANNNYENCSPWTETMNPDGTVTRTRTCDQ